MATTRLTPKQRELVRLVEAAPNCCVVLPWSWAPTIRSLYARAAIKSYCSHRGTWCVVGNRSTFDPGPADHLYGPRDMGLADDGRPLTLTAQQQQDVLADFQEWSGGSQPCECGYTELQQYVDSAADADLPRSVVLAFLHQLQNDPSTLGDDT